MSKSSILSLVNTFSVGQADPITAEQYYDHILDDMGRAPWFVSGSLVTLTNNTSQYTLADDQIKMLGAFYDDQLLDRVERRTLESLDPNWRDHRGRPVAYTTEDEASKTYRLYPAPDRSSANFIFIYGSPLGLDYPPYSVLLLHTQIVTDLLPYLELPVMWEVLAREYSHESNHRDDQFADFAQSLSDVLWMMVR